MAVNDELRDLVAASCADVISAIEDVPDDEAFATTQDESGNTAADYVLLAAQDKAMLATGLGSQIVHPLPPVLSTRDDAKTTIGAVEDDLENRILVFSPADYDKPPSTLGYPIDCDLPTYRDCVVAHSMRDRARARAIRAIFSE